MFTRNNKRLQFKAETDLEDFVWINLQNLFNLQGLKRQCLVTEEVCDILAVDSNERLVVLELKNQVDRYIIQQLTRYYDNLLQEKPFRSEVDYRLPIRLIAITPALHKHNEIDQKYSKLNIEFFTFNLEKINENIIFKIIDSSSKIVSKVEIAEADKQLKQRENDFSTQQKIDATLHHYVRVRHAHKLGLPDVPAEELILSTARFKAKGSKVFKVGLQTKPNSKDKYVSVRVPSSITVFQFGSWVERNIPTAHKIVTPNGRSYSINRTAHKIIAPNGRSHTINRGN